MSSRLGSDAQLKVSTPELKSKSASVKKISNSMQNQYNTLKQIVDTTAGYWVGNGGDSHRRKFSNQQKDVDEMFRRINEHVVDLLAMAGVYEDTEAKITETIQDSLPSDVII